MNKRRAAIVTGGGRGLGRAMALGLARTGVNVIATAAREREQIESVAREGKNLHKHSDIIPMIADVSKEEDCYMLVDKAMEKFGRIDVLINNAARGMRYVSEAYRTEPTQFWEIPTKTWEMIINTNVTGPFLMAKAVVPEMIKAKWGRIVNIAINQKTMRRQGFCPYGPSKAALESETIIWSQDLEGTGVTVNALLPGGGTLTGMIPEDIPEQTKAKLLKPEIIVPPLLWLISPEADEMTGRRFIAAKWDENIDGSKAADNASEIAGWM